MESVDYGKLKMTFMIDTPSPDGTRPDPQGENWITGGLKQAFEGKEATCAVLGIDIYRYSQYLPHQQRIIPALFRYLYDAAVDSCTRQESALFVDASLHDEFIPTGDGGFQILTSPFQAAIFAIYLQTQVEAFNGFMLMPTIRAIVGTLRLRFAITFDTVFKLDSNFFGAAIINNSRLLARDHLNRCLIDSASVEWFQKLLGSVESLQTLTAGRSSSSSRACCPGGGQDQGERLPPWQRTAARDPAGTTPTHRQDHRKATTI